MAVLRIRAAADPRGRFGTPIWLFVRVAVLAAAAAVALAATANRTVLHHRQVAH